MSEFWKCIAETQGLSPRAGETDEQIKARLIGHLRNRPGTFDGVLYAANQAVEDAIPVATSSRLAKLLIAVWWLSDARPAWFFVPLAWVLTLLCRAFFSRMNRVE